MSPGPRPLIVPRTATVISGDEGCSLPLSDLRGDRAYVLLGDPGAGKTTAFEEECKADSGYEFVTTRRFTARSLDRHPEWRGKTLFIDGLDEARAGRSDARRPLDEILLRLEKLGLPNFRLSCRAADWLGRNDLTEIMSTTGYQTVRVLHLDPLTDGSVHDILVAFGEQDPHDFMASARERQLGGLLTNPHLLEMLVKATSDHGWPSNRSDALELACRRMVRERNDGHRAARHSSTTVSDEAVLSSAGQLSALLLLSDRKWVTTDHACNAGSLALEDISDGDQQALHRALRSNLFKDEGGGRLVPADGRLQEFLGARYLKDRIESGVPASRVLALMTGEDGVVVTALRGLSAWLAAFNDSARCSLTRTDPVGIALHGDVSRFGGDDIEALLSALARTADDVKPWTWPPVALASLIQPSTVALLQRYLSEPDRTEGRQTIVGLLLRALSDSQPMNISHDSLAAAVRDTTWWEWVRRRALSALANHCSDGDAEVALLTELLGDIKDGRVEDRSGELLGILLSRLYPGHIAPDQVWSYLRPYASTLLGGTYWTFWSRHLLKQTKERDVVPLRQALINGGEELRERLSLPSMAQMVRALDVRASKIVGEEPRNT